MSKKHKEHPILRTGRFVVLHKLGVGEIKHTTPTRVYVKVVPTEFASSWANGFHGDTGRGPKPYAELTDIWLVTDDVVIATKFAGSRYAQNERQRGDDRKAYEVYTRQREYDLALYHSSIHEIERGAEAHETATVYISGDKRKK